MKKLLIILFFVFLLSIGAKAQTKNFVVCYNKQLWLTNEVRAILFGNCLGKSWIAPTIIVSQQTIDENNLSKTEKNILSLLQNTSKEQIEPVVKFPFKLDQIAQNKNEIKLIEQMLPIHIKDFLEAPLEFIITSGIFYGEDYEETFRLVVRLPNSDPTIEEILNEIRNNHPDKERLEKYGKFFILEEFSTQERLDTKKRVSDYNLRNGDKIILSIDSERYLDLPPGVRGGQKKKIIRLA